MKAIVLNNGYVSCIVYLGGSNTPIKAVATQWRNSSPYWWEVVKACLSTGEAMRMRIDKIKGIWFFIVLHHLKCLFMHILFMQHEYKCKTCVV